MLVPHALHESLVVEPARLSRPLSGDQRILQRLNLGLVFFQAAQDMITAGIELPVDPYLRETPSATHPSTCLA